MKRLLLLGAVCGAMVTFDATTAEAGHGFVGRSNYGFVGRSNYGFVGRSNFGFVGRNNYGFSGVGVRNIYTPRSFLLRRSPIIHRTWHDTSHWDYHPGGLVPHGNHFHYIPGHYHLHRTGHWDTHIHH